MVGLWLIAPLSEFNLICKIGLVYCFIFYLSATVFIWSFVVVCSIETQPPFSLVERVVLFRPLLGFTGFYWNGLFNCVVFFFYRVFASSVATALLFSGVLPLFTAAGCAAITANHTLLFSLSLSLSQFFSLVLGRVAASYLSIVSWSSTLIDSG